MFNILSKIRTVMCEVFDIYELAKISIDWLDYCNSFFPHIFKNIQNEHTILNYS